MLEGSELITLHIETEVYKVKNAVNIDQLAIKCKEDYRVYKALVEG